MGTGWRRAFCTTIPRDNGRETKLSSQDKQQPPPSPSPSPSPRSVMTKLNIFSSSTTNPSTPKLQCKTTPNTPKSSTIKTKPLLSSTPSSPRSPLKLNLFKNSFRSRNNCGVCLLSVKTGQGTAIFTGECAHAFHFPCIAAHVKKQGKLICPVCSSEWKDVPLLAIHTNLPPQSQPQKTDVVSPKLHVNKKPLPDYVIRPYNDDEPLHTPRAPGGGKKFVPIPEADVEEDTEDYDDDDEFKGFFVNSTPSCSFENDSKNVEVRLVSEPALISVSRGYETYAVALKVKAPPAQPAQNSKSAPLLDPSRRAPIDLVTVLDVSGSMSGAKMQMLKRAMRLVVASLGAADRLSIVAFSACPKRLLPLRRMTCQGQKAARKIIDRLVCGQGTSVSDALRKAAKVLEDRRERNPVASIMLLSDGQDEKVQSNNNNNSSNNNQRSGSGHASSTRFAHVEISQEPAEDAFAKCVGGLLSVVLQDMRIQLGFGHGSAQAEILAVYCCNGRPTLLNSGSVRLGDLYAEEERELLVELRVPTSSVGLNFSLYVKCSYKDPATQEIISGRDELLVLPPFLAVRSSNPKVERLRNLFIMTRAIAESRRLVEYGEFSSAHHLLSSARALLMQSSLLSAEECVRGLEAELMELAWRRQQMEEQQQRRRMSEREMMANNVVDENGEPLTPTSAWRAAERLAKVAIIKKSLNKVSDLHGFENARF